MTCSLFDAVIGGGIGALAGTAVNIVIARRRERRRECATVSDVNAVYLWASGTVMVFDANGEQIPDLQGVATDERLAAIRARSTSATRWLGFGEDGPLVWRYAR